MSKAQAGSGRGWRFYVAAFIGLLAFVVVIQNTDTTNFKFLLAEAEMPLIFGLIIAILLGVAIGWLGPHVRRGRHVEKKRAED